MRWHPNPNLRPRQNPRAKGKARAAESPGKLAVRRDEYLASQMLKEATQARKTFDKAEKQYALAERIRDAKWTALGPQAVEGALGTQYARAEGREAG